MSKKAYIILRNLKSSASSPCQEVINTIHEQMKREVKGSYWSPKFRSGFWDGTVKFFDKRTQTFDTGLYSFVLEAIRLADCSKIEVIDERVRPKRQIKSKLTSVQLRRYQKHAVEIMLKSGRGLVRGATGCGKSEIMMAAIAKLGVPTIVLIDSLDLVDQTAKRICDGVGNACVMVIGSGEMRVFGNGNHGKPWIVVSTVQTLHSRKEYIQHIKEEIRPQMKISDEVHGAAADTWYNVMKSFDCYYSFGLSGSIYEEYEDEVRMFKIIGQTGRPIIDIPAKYLIERGVLAIPKVYMIKYRPESTAGMQYSEEYDSAVAENRLLNYKIVPEIVRNYPDKRIMVLVNKIKHGRIVQKCLRRASKRRVTYLHGSDSLKTRTGHLNAFRNDNNVKNEVIIASKIFSKGIDVPNLEVLISLGCDDSYKSVIQKIGRGLRRTERKSKLIFYDILPVGTKFVEKHSRGRLEKYAWLGYNPKVLRWKMLNGRHFRKNAQNA